jgi:hypothetical protein
MNAPRFVAGGHDGAILVSPDGRAWKESARGKEGEIWRAAAFGNGRFVLVGTYGGANLTAASADGAAWPRVQRDGQYRHYLRGVGFGNGVFLGIGGDPVSVGDSKPFVSSSADGAQWSDFHFFEGKNILRRVAFGAGVFVGVGDRGRRSSSKDGRSWTDVPGTKAPETLVDVAHGPAGFVGVGLHGLRIFSPDGSTWEAPQRGEEGEHLNSILWAGDRFVAVGQGATWISKDGRAWTRHPNQDAPQIAVWSDGLFAGTAWKGRLLVSKDGIAWETVHKAGLAIEALAARA